MSFDLYESNASVDFIINLMKESWTVEVSVSSDGFNVWKCDPVLKFLTPASDLRVELEERLTERTRAQRTNFDALPILKNILIDDIKKIQSRDPEFLYNNFLLVEKMANFLKINIKKPEILDQMKELLASFPYIEDKDIFNELMEYLDTGVSISVLCSKKNDDLHLSPDFSQIVHWPFGEGFKDTLKKNINLFLNNLQSSLNTNLSADKIFSMEISYCIEKNLFENIRTIYTMAIRGLMESPSRVIQEEFTRVSYFKQTNEIEQLLRKINIVKPQAIIDLKNEVKEAFKSQDINISNLEVCQIKNYFMNDNLPPYLEKFLKTNKTLGQSSVVCIMECPELRNLMEDSTKFTRQLNRLFGSQVILGWESRVSDDEDQDSIYLEHWQRGFSSLYLFFKKAEFGESFNQLLDRVNNITLN